jgi:hypothetical protein
LPSPPLWGIYASAVSFPKSAHRFFLYFSNFSLHILGCWLGNGNARTLLKKNFILYDSVGLGGKPS